jgi:hypothetical protein
VSEWSARWSRTDHVLPLAVDGTTLSNVTQPQPCSRPKTSANL